MKLPFRFILSVLLGALWQQILPDHNNRPRFPWWICQNMVIALVDAVRPTGGYSIDLTAVQPTDQGVFVTGGEE